MPLSVLRGQRSPTDRWSTKDADLAVAYTQYKASLCTGCGVPQHLAWDYKASHDRRHRPRWVPQEPSRCYVCTAREQGQNEFIDENTRTPSALRFSVTYRPE